MIRKPLSLMFSHCGEQNVECSNRRRKVYFGCEVSMALGAHGEPRAAHLPPLTMEQVGSVRFGSRLRPAGISVRFGIADATGSVRLSVRFGSLFGFARFGSRFVRFSVRFGPVRLGSARFGVLSALSTARRLSTVM